MSVLIFNNYIFSKQFNKISILRNLYVYISMQFRTTLFNRTENIVLLFRKIKRPLSHQLKFCNEIEVTINKQVQAEQQAAQDYLSIAVKFLHPTISRLGTGAYFMKMYYEELDHMQVFIQYQLMRGGTPIIKDIKEPSRLVNDTLLCAFEHAFKIEYNVTELMENLVRIAETFKDYQCSDFVTSVFLQEQRLALNELSHHITKLSRLKDNEYALYQYDLHLANSSYLHKNVQKHKES